MDRIAQEHRDEFDAVMGSARGSDRPQDPNENGMTLWDWAETVESDHTHIDGNTRVVITFLDADGNHVEAHEFGPTVPELDKLKTEMTEYVLLMAAGNCAGSVRFEVR